LGQVMSQVSLIILCHDLKLTQFILDKTDILAKLNEFLCTIRPKILKISPAGPTFFMQNSFNFVYN
jgi:hypothetical protein